MPAETYKRYDSNNDILRKLLGSINYLISITGGGGGGGDASAANQVIGNNYLASIDGKTLAAGQALMAASSPVVIASNQTAIPISAASLPLPSGAATEATLSTLNGKVTAVNTGAVVISSSALPSGASTSALQTTGNTSLSSIDGKFGSLGQKTMAGSAPVVLASDQAAIPVTAAGISTAALQTTGNTSLSNIDTNAGAISDAVVAAGATGSISAKLRRLTTDLGTLAATVANTNVETGYRLKRITANFTRPNDTNTYAAGDAITNSTSAPVVFSFDLATVGAVVGQSIEIRKLSVVTSTKQSLLLLANVYLSGTTFTATNDNAALDIADATVQTGGSWFNCTVQNFTASNSIIEPTKGSTPMVLDAADTKLYGTMQAANAYIPPAQEVYTIILWVALL